MVGKNKGHEGKTYADYLRQQTRFNEKYIMPKGARPPQRKSVFSGFEDAPIFPNYRSKSIETYIRESEQREKFFDRDIRKEIVREIQQDGGLA